MTLITLDISFRTPNSANSAFLQSRFAGPDRIGVLHGADEDLAVADKAGPGLVLDHLEHLVLVLVVHHHHDHGLGQFVVMHGPDSKSLLLPATEHGHLRKGRETGALKRQHDFLLFFRPDKSTYHLHNSDSSCDCIH